MSTAWQDLTPDAISSLKLQIFQAIVSSAATSLMVARKLLVVLSTFALHVRASALSVRTSIELTRQAVPESWENVVEETMQYFASSSATLDPELAQLCAVEALGILTEEVQSATMAPNRIALFKRELLSKEAVVRMVIALNDVSTDPSRCWIRLWT